jgi:hypothetical protein
MSSTWDRREGLAPNPTRSLPMPFPNPVQTQRFLQCARNLSYGQLRQIQTDFENPALGGKLRIGHADYKTLAREQGIAYSASTWWLPNSGESSYGPGLQPLAEAAWLIAHWQPYMDLKDFINVYAPFLKHIPLAEVGLSDDWMALEDPARHRPIVAEYETVLEANRGARACSESSLPAPRHHVIASLCFQAALDPAHRAKLADELVEVASFVPETDATLVVSSQSALSSGAAAAVLERIRNRELELMRWLGTIDTEQLDEARRNLAGSAIAIGSDASVQLADKSTLLTYAYVLGGVVGLAAGVVTLISLPKLQNTLTWIACLIWSWMGGVGAAALVSNWLVRAMAGLLHSMRRSVFTRAVVLLVSAIIAGLVAATPWLLLTRFV